MRVVTHVLLLPLVFVAATSASIHSFRPRSSQASIASTPGAALAAWSSQSRHQRRPSEQRTGVERRCAPGCESNGNCNRALGACECPFGYTGPTCSDPLWPSCQVSPKQQEVYCSSDWRPKSCACLEQCAAFVCPDGTHASCERDFDLHNAKCFQREGSVSITTDGAAWDGGSDLPEDTEDGVKYFKGWLHKQIRQEIKRQVLQLRCLLATAAAVAHAQTAPVACPHDCLPNMQHARAQVLIMKHLLCPVHILHTLCAAASLSSCLTVHGAGSS
jgi:hypothetical protein